MENNMTDTPTRIKVKYYKYYYRDPTKHFDTPEGVYAVIKEFAYREDNPKGLEGVESYAKYYSIKFGACQYEDITTEMEQWRADNHEQIEAQNEQKIKDIRGITDEEKESKSIMVGKEENSQESET